MVAYAEWHSVHICYSIVTVEYISSYRLVNNTGETGYILTLKYTMHHRAPTKWATPQPGRQEKGKFDPTTDAWDKAVDTSCLTNNFCGMLLFWVFAKVLWSFPRFFFAWNYFSIVFTPLVIVWLTCKIYLHRSIPLNLKKSGFRCSLQVFEIVINQYV